jgi:hypothetical protein
LFFIYTFLFILALSTLLCFLAVFGQKIAFYNMKYVYISPFYVQTLGPCSSVGIATDYKQDGPGSNPDTPNAGNLRETSELGNCVILVARGHFSFPAVHITTTETVRGMGPDQRRSKKSSFMCPLAPDPQPR